MEKHRNEQTTRYICNECVDVWRQAAPAMAQIALQKNADEGDSINPDAARTIKDTTDMEDILDSVNPKEEAKKLTNDVDRILEKGG